MSESIFSSNKKGRSNSKAANEVKIAISAQLSTGTIMNVRVSGQMLKDILEFAVRKCPKKAGIFPHVSGVTFTVDLSVESHVRVEGPYRVSEIRVGGRELDPLAEYTLTTSDYLINGGDGFEPFRKAAVVSDTGKMDCDIVIGYIENDLGGVIPDRYRTPLGRIRIIGS